MAMATTSSSTTTSSVDQTQIIQEGYIKHYDGKWKKRWATIVKLSPVADCLHMNLYKSYREYSHNQRKSATAGAAKLPCKSILLEHFLGMESGFLWSGESCTLAVICRPTIVLMALETHEMLAKWMDELRANWTGQEHHFAVQIIDSPPGGCRIRPGPARLLLRNHTFCLINQIPPKLMGVWRMDHLRRFGSLDQGRFVFEGGSKCDKGTVGVFALHTDQSVRMGQLFEQASRGRLSRSDRQDSGEATESQCFSKQGWSTLRGSNHNHNDQLDHLNPSTSSSSSAIYAVPNNKKVQMLQDDRNHNGGVAVASAYGSILSVRDTLMMSTCCPLHPNGGGDAPSTLLPSSSLSSPSTVSLSLNSDQDQDQESLFSNESIHSNSSNGSNHGNSVSYSGRTVRSVADSSTHSLNRKYSFTHHSSNTMDCNGQSGGNGVSKWATLDNGACCSMAGNQNHVERKVGVEDEEASARHDGQTSGGSPFGNYDVPRNLCTALANCQIQLNTTRISAPPTTSNCHCPLQNIGPDNVPDHNDNVVNKRKHPNNAAAVLFSQHNSGALWMNADALLNHRSFPNYANVDPRGRSCCANNYENVNFIHQQQQSASVPVDADNKTLVDG